MQFSYPPLTIESFSLGELQTNCYLVCDAASREALIIDPADSGDFLTQTVHERDLHLSAIVLTHGHFDHVLGLLELRVNFPDVGIFIHEADQELLARAQASAEHWLKHSVDPVPSATQTVAEGATFSLGSQQLAVLHTPGHTPGSIVLSAATADHTLLFTGDTLFKHGVGRTDFSYSSPLQLEHSLRTLFETLPGSTICLPGHGEPTTLSEEA